MGISRKITKQIQLYGHERLAVAHSVFGLVGAAAHFILLSRHLTVRAFEANPDAHG
jgi:hypothetical protein